MMTRLERIQPVFCCACLLWTASRSSTGGEAVCCLVLFAVFFAMLTRSSRPL